MKIGFDAKRLFLNQSGLGNYSRTLVRELKIRFPEDEHYLYSPRTREGDRTNPFLNGDYRIVTARRPRWMHAWWRSKSVGRLAANEGMDVFHGLSNEIPKGLKEAGIPSVVTIHDLIFLKFPHYYPRIDRNIYRRKVVAACRNADAIVAISQRTADDLIGLIGVPKNRIRVIYQGCDDRFKTAPTDEVMHQARETLNLHKPFIISVGTLEARKNQLTLVEAFASGRLSKSHDLVLIGRETGYARKVRNLIASRGLDVQVKIFSSIDHLLLPTVLHMADLMVYPSEYEGFGLPVLEAMTSGVPVIAASGSCLEEVGGEAARYVSAHDVKGLATAMEEVLLSSDILHKMTAMGKERARLFDNATMAGKYRDLYSSLIRT